MKCLSVKRGHFKPSETQRSALGLRASREGRTGKPNSRDASHNTGSGSGSSVCDAQNAHTHRRSLTLVCAWVTRHSPEKAYAPLTDPLPSSLGALSTLIKVCLRLWVTLQVTSETPTQPTLLHYISSIKAVLASFHSC